ncbi:MAG: PA14 domain-containing protein [Bacteroidales bacterium]|nr:PA14 domain-containing protein [Bacteroidales bacterium]
MESKGWKLWLDKKAVWQNDPLFLPPADLARLPVNSPTCGWNNLFNKVLPENEIINKIADPTSSFEVQVPGTVEEFCWDAISGAQKGLGRSGDYVGVSWWGRDFIVPADAKGKRIKLYFTEGIRQRAEIFINQKLTGYELVHQTPFEVDVTDAVQYGATNKLAVRITDPNGNFSWGDYTGTEWGSYYFPLSHGFGGILGTVVLKVVDPVHVSDVFVKNKATLKDVDAEIELSNDGKNKSNVSVDVAIVEAWKHNQPVLNPKTVYTKSVGKFTVEPGKNMTVNLAASVPSAALWNIRDANLYNLVVTIKNPQGKEIDRYSQRFGFRFMSVVGYGVDARYYLNGKRTFFLSAISWGFWPVNGIFPTPELARKHVESALALGQNMLNFHRCQGNTLVLNAADELGMLYYEEPGGYNSSRTKDNNPLLQKLKDFNLARQLNSQRFLRMVKRDRNHPSLVIYNMVNEPGWSPDEQTRKDMADAHLLDPTRVITYGSGFMNPGKEEPQKLHMLPYDQKQYTLGFCDVHNAGNSPGVYSDYFYNSPTSFRRNERDEKELFVWGEEGAIASPPQLELINNQYKTVRHGWDGSDYSEWYQAYVDYIKNKKLEKYYPSLTKLITSMGDIMYYEHGRLLENVRIADGAELNVLNGYEDMKFDNMSGAVDVFRNLKGDPTLISQYMAPLFVAVKARDKIGEVGETNLVDLFVINEHVLSAGNYVVKAEVINPDGKTKSIFNKSVRLSDGDKFSNFVAEKVPVVLNGGKGYYKIKAELQDLKGKKLANGHEEILAVDWKSDVIGGKGAVLGGGPELIKFAKDIKKANIVPYSDALSKLDYVVVGSIDQGSTFKTISPFNCRALDGKTLGLNMDYFRGKASFDQLLDKRISTAGIDFNMGGKIIPGYDILGETDFTVRWQGFVVPDVSGPIQFEFIQDDGGRVWFDGKLVVDSWGNGPAKTKTFEVNLEAGKSYPIKIEAYQAAGSWQISLKWKLPVKAEAVDMAKLLKRVQQDGTKLLIIEGAESWVKDLAGRKVFPEFKVFHPAKTWVGSNFFVREHPFFEGLPVNGGMNWEYQRLVMYDGPNHFGLYGMSGEEPIVSLVGGVSHLVATSMGIVPYGNGQIVFSSLDLAPNLIIDSKAAAVPKKIFCNLLKWAGQP